jgi:hypothetical protein
MMRHMMQQRERYRRSSRLARWAFVAMLALAPATTAFAARDEVEADPLDARLEGYAQNVTLPVSSSGLTWMCFVGLMILVAGGLFKDAKRTHLD